MPEMTVWIHIFATILMIAGICCFMAAFADSLRMVVSSLFTVLFRPISVIQERISAFLKNIKIWVIAQLEDESDRKGEGPVYYIIGAVIYSILTGLFILCDLGMAILTVEAMGLEKSTVSLPFDTSTITASTLVTTSLFWGAIFFDLIGVTRLAPWRKSLSPRLRRTFILLSVFFFILSVTIGVAMAYWRGYMTVDFMPENETAFSNMETFGMTGLSIAEEASANTDFYSSRLPVEEEVLATDNSTNWVVYASLMGISGLSLSSTAFSVVGLVILFKFIILMLIALCTLPLLPVAFVMWLIGNVLEGIFNLVQRIIDFFINVGTAILQCSIRREGKSTGLENDRNSATGEGGSGSSDSETEPDPGFNPFFRR